MYLPEAANEALLTKCAALCCAGSRIGMDILPNRLMNNKNFVELYAERGHPLRYTSDDPMPMLARCGWRGTSHSSPEVAAKLGRSWPVPANAPTTLAGFILADRIN